MKCRLTVADADKYFEAIQQSKMFSAEKSFSGYSLRYNGVFSLISNNKINLSKISETEIEIDILHSAALIVISALFTVFFWVIGIIGIATAKFSIPLIIAVFLLPLPIWVLQMLFHKSICRQIIDALKKEDSN